jgi:transposase
MSCPDCRVPSRRIQSRYQRRAADLPLGGRRVELQVLVRRFWCDATACRRKIFAERFPDGALSAFARRTARLEQILHHVGLALGGRPGAGLAQRLMLPVSRNTLLRVVRRRATTRSDPLDVVGIDDFAWRRNHRYGTLVCDLERRRIVALLPDREQATA